jgi:hypothetical protein
VSDSEQLLIERRQLIEQIESLHDTLHDFYVLAQHIWQNREEFFDLLSLPKAEGVPETIDCYQCDTSIVGLAEALNEGWDDLARDDGLGHNYLGTCPTCLEEMEPPVVPEPKEKPKPRTLFDP